jgi:hypothetical protein
MSADVSTPMPELTPWSHEIPAVEPAFDVVKFRESDEGKALAAWADQVYTSCKSAREKEEQQWKLNYAMFDGRQYADIVRQGPYKGFVISRPPANDKQRRTINRIEAAVRTEISRLTSQKPSASVLPASPDEEDLFAAMAGEQVWESLYTRRDFHSVITDAALWLSVTGNVFLKTYWDNSAFDRDAGTEGDIIFEAVTPFNILVPDLRETRLEAQPYLINMYTKPVEWLHMFFGDVLKDVVLNPSQNADNEILDDAILNTQKGTSKTFDSCLVKEYWIKPNATRHCRNGGYLVMVDNIIVAYQETWPYDHAEFPFAHVGHIPSGKFYRKSPVTSLNELQKEYNSIRSQMADARVKMGKPQILAEEGSISAAKVSNTAGLVISYRRGYQPPQPMPMAQLPAYITQEQQDVLTDFEDISGQHQVSKGNVPPGVTAATAISYLQEKDDSYLVPTYQSLERACEKVARQALSLVVQFWDLPRLVKVTGEDNSFDAVMLSGSDIASGTDIRIEGGSALPTSKAARQAFLMDLMAQGFITPDQGLEMLELGGAQKLMDSLKADKRQAQRENIRLKNINEEAIFFHQKEWELKVANGAPDTIDPNTGESLDPNSPPPVVTPNSFDNHDVHIEVHQQFQRSQAYEFLPDAIKVQFEQHVQLHRQMKQAQMLQDFLGSVPSDGSVPGISGVEGSVGEETPGGGAGVPTEPTYDFANGNQGNTPEQQQEVM